MPALLRTAAIVALFVPVAASIQAQPAPQTVVVTLSSYDYDPSPLVLKAGQPVRLVFQNKAGKGHDFTAPEFFKASRILSGKVDEGEVDLDGGESAVVELVPAKGTYRVHCGKFLHSTMGMKSRIVVQ